MQEFYASFYDNDKKSSAPYAVQSCLSAKVIANAVAPKTHIAVGERSGIIEIKSYCLLDTFCYISGVCAEESIALAACKLIGLCENSGDSVRIERTVHSVHDDLYYASLVIFAYPA